jgi:hypothetical protein
MAAGNTYVALATTTLGSSATSVTFSSISGAYTDLVLVTSSKKDVATAANEAIRFNSDTGSNYSYTILTGTGSVAQSGRATSTTSIALDDAALVDNSIFRPAIVSIQNYSNSTTYKTILSRANNANRGVDAIVGLWRNTAAITSITVILQGGTSFASGSTFSLYGILAA